MNTALNLAIALAQQERVENLRYDLAKKVSDMHQRGVRIETSYGEIEIDGTDGQRVARLVKKILERKLQKALSALPQSTPTSSNGASQ